MTGAADGLTYISPRGEVTMRGNQMAQDFYVAEALSSGALVSLLDEARPPDEGVWAVHPHPRHVPPKVRAMIDWLHDRLAQRSPA